MLSEVRIHLSLRAIQSLYDKQEHSAQFSLMLHSLHLYWGVPDRNEAIWVKLFEQKYEPKMLMVALCIAL